MPDPSRGASCSRSKSPRLESPIASRAGSTARVSSGLAWGTGFATGILCTLAVVGGQSSVSARARATLDRATFHHAVDDVLDRYVDPVNESRLLARGLKQMVAELDHHSHYLTVEERTDLQQRARGGDPGLSVVLRGTQERASLEVVAVAPGSAAARAGVEPGNFIVNLAGRPIRELSHQVEVETLLRGPVGESVTLTVQAPDRTGHRTVALQREDRDFASVATRIHDTGQGKVAIVRLRSFRPGTGERLQRQLSDARLAQDPAPLAGIVLDLRNNPGGEVDEALIIADAFVASGLLTRTRGRGGRILREEAAHAAGTDTTTPLVVLQNRHSASAAELLAAALQDHGRARIVGERSFGKGTVQEIRGLDDGSVLAFTIARYYSPHDRRIDGEGVDPEVDLAVDGPEAVAQEAAARLLVTAP